MDLGSFSLSLAVKDLTASRTFYEKLGFEALGGASDQGWLIMKNEACTLGLFQGMFEKNMLTFNPGWNDKAETLEDFTNVREIQTRLKARGLELVEEAKEGTGPAHCVVVDPDGNPILIDQHV